MKRLLALLPLLAACASGTTPSSHATTGTVVATTTGVDSPSTPAAPAIPLVRDSRATTEREQAMIAELVALTSRVRRIEPLRAVTTRIASRDVIAAHLMSQIEDEELVELVDLYVALAMLERGTDVTAILARVVGEQVIGFYDPKLDVLVVRDDVMAGFARTGHLDPEALVTIAHEIVHALQGQRLELRERMDADLDIDVSDAYQSLVEGDATLSMLLVAADIRRTPIDAALALLPNDVDFAAGLDGPDSQALAGAPPIVRIGMTAPYIAGLSFCAHLFRHGGTDAIDRAHARIPASTEQVIHPDKYLADEAPEHIDLGSLPQIEAAGFTQTVEHTLGELELGIYLGRGTTHGYDPIAGSGWGGDRVRVYRRNDALAAVLVASFDSETDAIEAERAASRATGENTPTVVRVGRVLATSHGLDALDTGANEAVRERAREIAESLDRRPR